jgi:hypothetical protein
MTTIATSNITSGFIDLATYDQPEKYYYGGADATAYFVRETRKATWFTQVPVILSRASGQPQFNQQWSVNVSRAGDYLLYSWLRVVLPSITLSANNQFGDDGRLRWTRNIAHNLINEAAITFNDLVAMRFDNYFLDFWAAFTVPAGKRNGYNNMIGAVDDLVQPRAPGDPFPSYILNLPLPFFFSRDSGVALPTAALPYNDMRIQFSFRNWNELLILDNIAAPVGTNPSTVPTVADFGGSEPQLGTVQVWANYAIVSNDERKRMGCAPRDILMEQVQTAPIQTYTPASNPQPSFDIRFSHAIKVLFFGVRNKTTPSEWSNYSAASPLPGAAVVNFSPAGAVDPILQTTVVYENTQRLQQMGSDYFTLVAPYYHSPVIPVETGYHMYSYSLDFYALDPTGSTNYGKLTNVSVVPQASAGAIAGGSGTGAIGSGADYSQLYDFLTVGVNMNIIRISGGALGFPIL